MIPETLDFIASDTNRPEEVTGHESACATCANSKNHPLCKAIYEIEREYIKATKFISLKKNESLIISKTNSSSIFIVKEGLVKLKTSSAGQKSIDILYKGTPFGGLELVTNDNVNIRAIAVEKTTVCEIPFAVLQPLLAGNSRFLNMYLMSIGILISNLREQKNSASHGSVYFMVAKSLYKDFKVRGYIFEGALTVTKVLSHSDWAIHFGTTRESVTRAFRRLTTENIIRAKPGGIILVDEYKLLQAIHNQSKACV
jgi:CRP-like cAMP-binding protein